ncbi:MAG: DNA-protecting protein DprA [Parasporobacterium sp.]|nr:DNA-protecting protein DprA [Parasporobacterium sp.]
MSHEEYWFWLCNIKHLYRDNINRLLGYFGAPEEIYRAKEEQLTASGTVDSKTAREIVTSRNAFRSAYKLDKLKNDGIRFIHYGGPDYPEAFAVLPDCPYSLYVKGNMPDPEYPSVGIVGSRQCSGYGKEMTLKYAQTLAANGVQIISGMAAGVDSFAARGAIEAGGRTFAVLGSGLDVIYPAQNIELYYQIILNGGGVISEYPMGTAPAGWQFPHRNRLISALSDKLIIIEAGKNSGTLSTASHALNQGKDVFALPGRVTDPLSEGCNKMIADGAGVLLSPEYFLDDLYGADRRTWSEVKPSGRSMPCENGLQSIVLKALSYEPATVDSIASAVKMHVTQVAEILTEMELSGLCIQVSKDCYALE